MLRVDQAGEYGATRIYAGQLAVLRRNSPAAKLIARMAAQEERHLDRFNALMAERRVRPTALPAAVERRRLRARRGDRADVARRRRWPAPTRSRPKSTAITAQQLDELGDDDPELAADIAEFRAEELEHRDTARDAWRGRGARLSAADRGDPCRLPGGDRAVEAHLTEPIGGVDPLLRD